VEAIKRSKGIEILQSLAENSKCVQDIQKDVGGSATTLEDRIHEFIKEGLVKEEVSKDFPFKRMLFLTEKGRVTKEMITNMGNAFDNSLPDVKHKWILSILYALGEVKGVTRLEKLLFMLKYEMKVVEDEFYNFVPQNFGPYSEEIISDVSELKKIGLVKISGTVFEPFKQNGEIVVRWNFDLTDSGSEIAKSLFSDFPERTQNAIQSLKKFNEMNLKEFLNYIHKKYKEFSIS